MRTFGVVSERNSASLPVSHARIIQPAADNMAAASLDPIVKLRLRRKSHAASRGLHALSDRCDHESFDMMALAVTPAECNSSVCCGIRNNSKITSTYHRATDDAMANNANANAITGRTLAPSKVDEKPGMTSMRLSACRHH
jgi:hypothetical protein